MNSRRGKALGSCPSRLEHTSRRAPPPPQSLTRTADSPSGSRYLRFLSNARFHCLTPPTMKLHCTGILSGFAEHATKAFTAPIKCQIIANWFKTAPSEKGENSQRTSQPLRPAAALAVIHSAASFTRLEVFPSQTSAFLCALAFYHCA